MSNVPESAPQGGGQAPNTSPAPAAPQRSSLWWLLPLIVLVMAGSAAAYAYYVWASIKPVNFPEALRSVISSPAGLDEGFTDADGDLQADAPAGEKQGSPDELIFGVLEQGERAKQTWKEFSTYLAQKTGKKVKLIETKPGGTDVNDLMKGGKLHIAAFSTGAVPLAVNRAGFIPVCVPANAKGEFGYQMEILVRPDSAIKRLGDLRGKVIRLGSMSSLSSFKAPLMVLYKEEKMLPGRDYDFRMSEGQTKAIEYLLKGEDDVVAVANDLLAREITTRSRDPKLKDVYTEDNYRSIYKSDTYPPVCFGHVYNLKPELAGKIKEAFLSFEWEKDGKATGVKKEFGPGGATKFVAVNYKKDWEAVRKMDSALLELVEQGK